MLKHYEARFNELTREKDWTIQRLEFRSELVFLVKKCSEIVFLKFVNVWD